MLATTDTTIDGFRREGGSRAIDHLAASRDALTRGRRDPNDLGPHVSAPAAT
jgi:hypothetical protein